MREFQKELEKLNACKKSRDWVNRKTFSEAWATCERGDWMLSYAGRVAGPVNSPSRRKLVGVAAECAELVLPIFEAKYPKNKRVRKCIEACKRYAAGEIDMAELRKYRAAANAYAAVAAAYAVAYADDDAYAYAAAAAAAAAYAVPSRSKTLKQCADIVRKNYPNGPKE